MKHRTILLNFGILAGAMSITLASPAFGQASQGGPAATPPPGIADADFDTLSAFAFEPPQTPTTNATDLAEVAKQIPDSVKKMDGKAVRITGFMMPVKESSDGKTTEFLVTRNQPNCCFSGVTGMNEFITVKMPDKGVDEDMENAIAVEGTLHVGVETEGGYVTGIYKLDGLKMVKATH